MLERLENAMDWRGVNETLGNEEKLTSSSRRSVIFRETDFNASVKTTLHTLSNKYTDKPNVPTRFCLPAWCLILTTLLLFTLTIFLH